MSGQKVLEKLKADPVSACQEYRFEVDSDIYQVQNQGGECKISCSKAAGNIYILKASAGTGAYYYPWRPSGVGGLGWVEVPKKAANGTLVITGGMNGCSLYVNDLGNQYIFTHDADGKHFNVANAPGKNVCKVTYKDYATPLELGRRLFEEKMKKALSLYKELGSVWFAYFLITVKHGGRWKVLASGVVNVKNKFGVSFGITPLIASCD